MLPRALVSGWREVKQRSDVRYGPTLSIFVTQRISGLGKVKNRRPNSNPKLVFEVRINFTVQLTAVFMAYFILFGPYQSFASRSVCR